MPKAAVNGFYFQVHVDQHAHTRRATKQYVSAKQRKAIITTLGDSACMLFMYYVDKAGVPGFGFKDSVVAHALGWPIRKVQKERLRLVKAGWLYQYTERKKYSNQGTWHTCLGTESVLVAKISDRLGRLTHEELHKFLSHQQVDSIEELMRVAVRFDRLSHLLNSFDE